MESGSIDVIALAKRGRAWLRSHNGHTIRTANPLPSTWRPGQQKAVAAASEDVRDEKDRIVESLKRHSPTLIQQSAYLRRLPPPLGEYRHSYFINAKDIPHSVSKRDCRYL